MLLSAYWGWYPCGFPTSTVVRTVGVQPTVQLS